ncbi:MAG TPA: EAL domain-containing protein [Azospira sp.]|nr:EAL domain-containing protein [Azospira sp.]
MMGNLERTRLMLVEDERIVAFDLQLQLQELGYEVVAAVADGEAAVRQAEALLPDLVLMDIHLAGGMDGIEVAIEIQSRLQIPVIFLTAFAEDETLVRALDSRPFGYLIKPCETRELHAMIQMALARHEVEMAVEQSELRLRLALDAADLAVLELDLPANQLYGDGRLSSLLNRNCIPIDESWDEFIGRIAPEDRERVVQKLEEAATSGRAVSIEFRTLAGRGRPRILQAHAKAYRGKAGGERIISIVQDITQRRRDEERLRQSSVVFHTAAEAIIIADANCHIVAVNAAFTRITGYEEEAVLGADMDQLLRSRYSADSDLEKLLSSTSGYWQGEVFYHRSNGESFPAWQNLNVVRDETGSVTHVVNAFSDVTDMHRAKARLDRLAHHDPLTGLPNRVLLNDRLDRTIAQAHRTGDHCLLLFLDLDRFKAVNDTLGHAMGDQLLCQVADRLSHILRQSDTIARLGGDEFVILTGDSSPEYGANVAQKVLDVLQEPFTLGDDEIRISGSIGIAIFPEDGVDGPQLMRAADIAMYSIKSQGRNGFSFFSPVMSERAGERMFIEQGLRRAMEFGTLEVHYQPKIDLNNGVITGVEALVRWRHPEQGLIEPDRFISIAEESGIIDRLGIWVLRQACLDTLGLLDAENKQLRLAVNVSVGQFLHTDFPEAVREVLEEVGFPAEALELEITESTLQVIEQSVSILYALKELGVTVSLDDFGTGYSSLSMLRHLPLDRIKIDRSFIVELHKPLGGQAIVQAVVDLSHALKMGIVVEGIERTEQAEMLQELGCEEGQGYLFSRPLPHGELVELLAQSAGQLGNPSRPTLH